MSSTSEKKFKSESRQGGPAPRPGFWELRTGWKALKEKMLLEPLPGGARWAAAFGSLLLFTFVLQVVTGILLAADYAPSVASAYPSVDYIQHRVAWGWMIRGLHHWGSSAMVILLLLHLIQVFVWGAYKKPRELTWMVGVILLALTLGLAFTGYLLPWDEKAYWATKVGLGIMSTMPVIGEPMRTLMQGGPLIGNLTLTRFFAVHTYVLPGLLIATVVVHMYLFRLHGVTPHWWTGKEELKKLEEPFFPGQVWKDGVVIFLLLLGLGAWVWYHPAPLGDIADPSKPYEARPEWYFMFMFQFLKYFPPPYEVVATVVVPGLFFAVLFFWPLLDRNPAISPRKRPVAIGLLAVASLGLVGFTTYAIETDVRMPSSVQAKAPTTAPVLAAGPVQKLDVPGIWTDNCLACHGVDGTGSALRSSMPTIPDFTNLDWQRLQSDQAILQRIQRGKPPLMPSFQQKLSPEQIRWLAFYVRAFALRPAADSSDDTSATTAPAATAPSTTRPAAE